MTLLTARDVATRLKVSDQTVYNMVKRREISFIKVGRLVRFDPVDVDAWQGANRWQDAQGHPITDSSSEADSGTSSGRNLANLSAYQRGRASTAKPGNGSQSSLQAHKPPRSAQP
ncbi:MAG: helix-turn-helix domain-containing protein [Chloroflexi bacterium]|nr:helix-turn-helix domain-containing protein [Chloroflexota bacterium]